MVARNEIMSDIKTTSDLVSAPRAVGEAVVVSINGEIDLHNSPELRSALLQALLPKPPKKLVLNLSLVPYMDSSAVAVLVEMLQKVRPGGGKVMLVSLQPRVKGLLQIARLDTIFNLAATEQDALAL
jgi:anti-sigma B factor antagonist